MTAPGLLRGGMVVVSLEAWDEVWRRNQYLVDGLLRRTTRGRVLFVEPPADPLHQASRRELPHGGAGLQPVAGYGDRLWRLQPTKWLPRRLGAAADRSLNRQVYRAARSLRMQRPLLWLNDPRAAGLTDSGWPVVYDITDDWLLAERDARTLAVLASGERTLLARADAVIVCSPALARTKGVSRLVHLIPNAVEVAAYRRASPRPSDLPDGPIALYLGTVHADRIDVALCCDVARALVRVGTLVLVGPAPLEADERQALEAAGVVLLGARPRRVVPAYLTHAEVLVVPHVTTAFTESLDPIKRYEYLAARRPVVATPVAGFRELAGPGVTLASGVGFAQAVASRLADVAAGGQVTLPAHPVADWSDRVESVIEVLASLPEARLSR